MRKFLTRLWVSGLMLLTLSQVCWAVPIPAGTELESVEELGFGFRRVTVLVDTRGTGQDLPHRLYHSMFLYYGDQRICGPMAYSLSPSGSYLIYQDGLSGNLFLYRRADGRRAQLTHFGKSVPTVVKFSWNEEGGVVTWRYDTEYVRFEDQMYQEPGEVQEGFRDGSDWFSAP